MNRHPLLALSLALGLFASPAFGAATKPPAEYAGHIAAIRAADAIADPLQRCLAYPDLPGNTWAPGVAKARCVMFQTPPEYPLDRIEATLAQPDGGATLDAAFDALLAAHFTDPDRRDHINIFLRGVFGDGDLDKAERLARAWLAASPDSPHAHAALGRVLESRGWKARGGRYFADTPRAKVETMGNYFVEAALEYGTALEANPKLLPACIGLMAIGRQSSDELQAYATDRCFKADPASYYVVQELMNAAEPRWGGSEAALRRVAAHAMARIEQNPVLAVFDFEHAYYAIAQMEDGDAQAIAVLEPAALRVPNAAYLRMVGGAYLRQHELWKALIYLSQALRFMPEYAQESRFRSVTLEALGETAWARADAERAVALQPDDGRAQKQLGDVLRALDGAAAAVPYYEAAIKDSRTRESTFNDYCGSLIDAKQLEKARRCVDGLLAAYPENPEGWRQRLVVIGYDAPGSTEAMERFLALHDPKRWDYHAKAAENVRKVLAARQGTASPADLFDARVMRARALERTTAGREYFKTIVSQQGNALEAVFNACVDRMPKGTKPELTAVMDVQADGTLANVAVRPANNWTACFEQKFAGRKLPAPPEVAEGAAYPIFYEISWK